MSIIRYQNFWAGLFFALLGAAFLIAGRELDAGSAAAMGPGFVPAALASILIVTGLALIVATAREAGPVLEPIALKPLVFVLGSMTLCWLILDSLGLVVSAMIMVAISSFATRERRLKEIPVVAVLTSAAVALIFVVGLKLLIPLWPRF